MRERARERELTKWGLEGGGRIRVEEDGSSDGDENEEKNKIAKLHHRRIR